MKPTFVRDRMERVLSHRRALVRLLRLGSLSGYYHPRIPDRPHTPSCLAQKVQTCWLVVVINDGSLTPTLKGMICIAPVAGDSVRGCRVPAMSSPSVVRRESALDLGSEVGAQEQGVSCQA